MKFKNKIKFRICLNAAYILIGAAIMIVSRIGIMNDSMSAFGLVFAVCGLTQLIRNVRIISSPHAMSEREVREKDERNIMLVEKARSYTFGIFTLCAGIAIIILYAMEQMFAGQIIAYALCANLFIYIICYAILKRQY